MSLESMSGENDTDAILTLSICSSGMKLRTCLVSRGASEWFVLFSPILMVPPVNIRRTELLFSIMNELLGKVTNFFWKIKIKIGNRFIILFICVLLFRLDCVFVC